MKKPLKIQSKIFMAFLAVILIPSLCVFIPFSLLYNFNNDVKDLNNINQLLYDTFAKVQENYDMIDDYDKFYEKLYPYLSKVEGRLQVIDKNGFLLFDSEDKKTSLEKKKVYIENSFGYDPNYHLQHPGFHRHNSPIFYNNELVASAVITKDMRHFGNGIQYKINLYYQIAAITTPVLLIVLILLFTVYLSKSILIPLKELNRATQNIAKGNLDFKVSYKRNDELGEFCRTFEEMRFKLKESLNKQIFYENSRKKLIACISHDLKTPITTLKGYIEGLQDGIAKNEEMFNRYLQVIHNEINSLDRLINDLFTFSQLETDKISIEKEEWMADEFFKDLLEAVIIKTENQNRMLEVPKMIPSVKLMIDPQRIKQVIDNLINNAIKYTKTKGLIRIETELKDSFFIVSIQDDGTGIPQEDLPYIFDYFYRAEKSRNEAYGGIGLGLPICKKIIEGHEGNISVKSSPGKGTTVIFELPIVQE